ncbi:MAG: hypothetical protein BGP05_01375 [Rhizobiales bacterium 62-47]|nr:hypothetical protein [Hyphomicrobiales bacterium]OJY12034.1 MAG: hypothetical protein BGP05_01375 [Rhizobiales bacterium 62-47]
MAVLSDETWRRHANPWSVWTRYAAFPLLVVAVWSFYWIGWWALAPVAAVVVWLVVNPRIFPPPDSTDNWASKAVLGERIWVSLKRNEVPAQHGIVPRVAAAIAAAASLSLIWAFVTRDAVSAFLSMALVMLAKTWFVDRMVWLFEDMKDANPEYRSWLY